MCLATIAACCGLSLVVFGRVPFLDWTANLRAIPEPGYATHFLNASWVGVVSRAHAPYLAGTLLSGATIAVMLWRVRSRDEDEAWLLLSIAAILACPIGWIYYQPMLLGPVVALALGGRLTHLRWVALTCLVPPLSRNMFQHGSVLIALTLGSVYFWGFLAVFVNLVLRPSVALTVGSIPTRLPQPREPLASAHA